MGAGALGWSGDAIGTNGDTALIDTKWVEEATHCDDLEGGPTTILCGGRAARETGLCIDCVLLL